MIVEKNLMRSTNRTVSLVKARAANNSITECNVAKGEKSEALLAKRISVFLIYREREIGAVEEQNNEIIKYKTAMHRRNVRCLLTSLFVLALQQEFSG